MYTANTMASAIEALGMSLPNSGAQAAVSSDKLIDCFDAGRRIVQMVKDDLKPSDIMTKEAFENAIRLNAAIGGSTNAVIHVNAIARHIGVELTDPAMQGMVIENVYIPAGGDEPDREINPKFGQKLDFLERMAQWADRIDRPTLIVGDFNIAPPREDDVWNHKSLLKIVSHTPIEVEHLAQTQDAGAWVDVTRQDIPEGRLYSWWSYRAADWDAADKGRRLDHVWATPDISGAAHGSRILRPVRGWEQPSDHVPVFASFDL